MSYQKDRDEFVAQIVIEVANAPKSPHDATNGAWRTATGTDLARLILRNAATLDRLAVKQCNDPWTDCDERQVEQARARIDEACKPWGIVAAYSRDPRGAVVKLLLPSGRYNSWGGAEEGFCVPTR